MNAGEHRARCRNGVPELEREHPRPDDLIDEGGEPDSA